MPLDSPASDYAILESTAGGVRIITLNRPERLNALTGQMIIDLNSAIRRADADEEARVVLITGQGRAFCAGRDMTDIQNSAPVATVAERVDDLSSAGAHVMLLRDCAKPVVAAINGVAVGGGLSIALNADIRVMASGAMMRTGYTRRALSPDGGMSYALPRLVGLSRALELILTGRDVLADEALGIGLVAAVFPDEGFAAAAHSYAAAIANAGPIALAYSKRLLRESLDNTMELHLRREMNYLRACMATDDFREGVAAFLEKRNPEFRGT
jgi:2-(1,2-epoxy-1,2-dihydrophenyl)acetyl-CoA isomerase